MNTNLNLDRIGKCLDAYRRHEGNEDRQYGFSVAMMREIYPEEESFDNATRRFFGVYGKTHKDVYSYFHKLYDDAKNPSPDVSAFANNPQGVSAEKSNEIIKSNSWLGFQNFTKRVSPEIRETAFRIVYAEGTRTDIAEAWADKLLSMPEEDRNAVLWGAYILNPEKASNFLGRVGTRVWENLGDNAFNFETYWEASKKGVNPHTIFDAVNELDAIGENGKVKPEKLGELNKRLNALRAENSMFNNESSRVYGEKIRNAVRRNSWEADTKEYTADFIEKEYAKGKRYKDAFNIISQIREIKRSNFGKQGIVAQTIEDATVVGVEMVKYVGSSALGTFISKNPIASVGLVSAVMYSEFKPQMFNALRHEGNMSVEDANKYANFATAGMVAANYIGYTSWIKAIKPSSYLLGTEISKANASDYFFHAIKEIPKTFIRQGGTETISEYAESVVDYATKLWAAGHANATFDETQLWENFCQDFKDTTRIMPTLMLGSTLLGGGIAVNKVRSNSGVGWNLKKLIAPSDAVNHTVQVHAAYAQAEAAAREAAEKLGGSEQSIDFVQKYQNAKTDAERAKLFEESFNTDEERENARALLENIDKFDGEIQKAFANILADAAKANARETEELDRRAQDIAVFNDVEEDSDGAKKFTIVESLLDKLGARDEVVMINTAEDLERLGFSPETAQEIFSQASRKGLYSAVNDKVYMLPSHFKNGVDAFRTFVHERGHWIAEKIKYTPEYRGMLSTIVQLTGGEENLRALLPASYANDNLNSLAEEYLMRVVERVAMEEVLNANQKGVWNFFKAKFKKWFGSDRTFASMADKQIAEIARDIYRRAVSEKPISGNYWESSTPENNAQRVSGQWEVVDASELITSTDKGYDDTLQPRNRSRLASTVQTSEIATFLDPTRLDSDTTTDKGAPIIDGRKMVISGNGRTLAIREAYASENKERARAYREFVLRRAEELGIDVDANIKTPVLVRRVDNLGDMTLADFAARSNKSQVAAMSNAENAIADARRILDAHLLDIFFPSETGDVLAASNNDFITRFIDIIGNREEYIDKHGNRKPNLAPRIKAAVLAATLNPEKRDIIEDLLDNPQGWSGLINGLLGSVANIAKLNENPDYSLSRELSEAVEIYVGLQRRGESVATFNAQEDFLRPQISEEVGFLVELFEKNSRTPTGISGVLNEYYNLVKNIDTTTQDMFGEENPSKIDELRAAYQKYSTSLTEEPNVSWRDTGEPTEAEIAEARRQKDEVKAKWTNPDGSMKKGYMLAPNGKPTNLTEDQWLQVRTPNFKKWFGDWEKEAWAKAAMDFLERTAPVANLTGQEFQKDGVRLTDKVSAYFNSIGNVARNEELGDVILNLEGIRDSIAHGIGRLKASAFMAVKDVIENGFIFNRQTNWKNRNYDSAVIVAPISINNTDYICEVVITRKPNENRFYLHEVEIKETLEKAFKTPTEGRASQASKLIIGKHIAEVKGNVSKVVDENGEPMVVYHGSTAMFNEFRSKFIGHSTGTADGRGFYFTTDKNYAEGFKSKDGRVIEAFLNIRDTLDYKKKTIGKAALRKIIKEIDRVEFEADGEHYFISNFGNYYDEGIDKVINEATESNYDFCDTDVEIFNVLVTSGADFDLTAKAIKDVTGKDGEIVPKDNNTTHFIIFNPNQVKSATDNVGTLNPDNPDIRWREVDTRTPEELDAIDKRHAELYERYKGGDEAAYGEALELVEEEANRKGYQTKAYHGTGADGYNVALADSSKSEYGEGNQAHGAGLYMAANRDTAEAYKYNAPVQEFRTIGGKTFEEIGISPKELNYPVFRLVDFLHSNGVEKAKEIINTRIESQTKRLKSAEKHLPKSKDGFDRDLTWETIKSAKREISNDRITLDVIDKILSKLKKNGLSISDYEYKISEGRVFDWLHNMKPDELLDEQLPFSKQNAEVKKKLRKLFKDNGKDLAELMKTGYVSGNPTGGQIYAEVQSVLAHGSKAEASRLLSKHGIRGITYDGRQDGRVFVSFEGGPAVKLQDAFTFDDNGELIPLSKRFDAGNPDMRWKDGTVLMPIDINILVARNIDALMNAIRKSHKSILAKKAELETKYSDDDKDKKSKIENDLRLYVLENFSSELVPIAKLSDEDFKFYRKQFGIRDRFVYTSFAYAIEHYFNRHPNTPIQNYLLLPDTIFNPDKRKEVGKWVRDELGEWIYDASQAFIKEYDKWHISTIKVDTQLTSSGKKFIAFKNFYGTKKEPYGNKKTIEDYWKNATSSSDSSRRQAKISTLNNFNRQNESSTDGTESQEENSHLKALLRQERSENPVIWASIVLAREILLGRPITSAKIDKVLPQDKFDGTKRQYALDRAKRIAEKTRLTQKDFVRDLDRAVQKAESDIFWQEEFVENAYRAFSKGGEEYGFAKQKLLQYLKNMRNKELAKVKGYETDDFDFNLVEAIFKAQESEPKRAKPDDSVAEETEEFETSDGEFDADVEISGKKTPLAPAPIRDVVAKIRMEVAKRVRNADGNSKELNEKYRKTLVNILTDAAKELTYGRERELIQQNIRGLGNLAYHNVNSLRARAIELKNKRDLAEKDTSLKSDYIETYNNIQGIYFGTYGGRGGVMNYFVKNYLDNPSQIPDPYSIYAEHIALRIFNRGVRDTKAQLLERFSGIIKRKGKKPSRMEREDKRKMAGAAQMRIYNIGRFAQMDAEELEREHYAAIDKLNNAGAHLAGDSDSGEGVKDFADIEDVRAQVANTIADIQMFGNLRDKTRGEMAQAVEFLEKNIEQEMQKQEEKVAKKKEEAAKKRKVISDALRMSKHNAHKDGALRRGGRELMLSTMPFDSLLAVLGESATGQTFADFDAWRRGLVARIDRANALVANETFRAQERLVNIVEECYSENFSDALKRLLKPDAKYEEFSNLGGESEGMKQPMSLANVLQLYASALQENYRQNVYAHRAKKNGDVEKLENRIEGIYMSHPDRESRKGEDWQRASEEIKSLESQIANLQKSAVSDYIGRLEKVLTEADKKFVDMLQKEYADALPALSAVSRRVIGLPIEQADALYMPAKIKRGKTFGEGAGQVPVVPKVLSPRVPHLRDFDETANPIALYLDRVRENAQFKHFSELYIEMRSIFGNEELQDLISLKCGENVLRELLDFVVDISSGKTRGYKNEYIQKANGLFALVALGFNLGSGVRQLLPGCFSWGTYIGTNTVLKNMASFFTPEGFEAAREIWRSENGKRRFSIGNLQIMEEMLATPEQNKYWGVFKRYALVFNRASDMMAISFVGQGVYRTGIEHYLRQGFSLANAKRQAMADMWQIAERTQASGRMHNMARWQRRGGDLGKGIGMFSAPPQLMFSKSAQDIRRAIALGIKTPEGRTAAWRALKTWATVSILVEGSYAASGVLWNALLKGFFDDDDDERIIKQMATGPFGGLFLFGRMIENSTSNRGIESIMPVAGLARPAGNIYDLTLDLMTFDLDKALEDLNKLGKSAVPLYRDFRKVIDNRILEEN